MRDDEVSGKPVLSPLLGTAAATAGFSLTHGVSSSSTLGYVSIYLLLFLLPHLGFGACRTPTGHHSQSTPVFPEAEMKALEELCIF